ncbi:glycosyltransferase 87 family protein [Parafrankia discariae]|uniref:glycosyltransferase 87 family protein n=1 Tax=Parafrankia discariae TaxID=365528 RepID=UPI0003760C6F|nr:glycosyltransferase 87 family protein [Parafrankia discariae]
MTARRHRGAAAAGPLVIAGLLALIWVGYVAPIGHFDVDVFLRAGAAVADGRDPYPPPGTPEVYSGFAFVYPYLVSLPFVPLSALPGAAELFIALSVLALLAACRLAGAGRWTFALVLTASCTITGLQMGTLNALLFCGLVALWRLRDVPVAAGILTAVLVYSKLFLVPVVLWLALTRRPRATAVALLTLAALFGVGEIYSPVAVRTYADMLSVLAREEAPDGLSLTGLLMNVGLGLGAATWVARATAGLLLAGCLWLARGRGRPGGDGLLFAGVVAAALVASPIVWSHYLLLLVAPLLAITHGGPGRPAAGGDPDLPLALFTGGSWLLVTPHLSTPIDLLVAAVVLGPLVALPLVRTARRRAGPAPATSTVAVPGSAVPGPAGSAPWAAPRMAVAALRAVLVAALVGGVGAVCWTAARARGEDTRVIGAYGALVGTLALLAWAVAASRDRGAARPGPVGPRDPLGPGSPLGSGGPGSPTGPRRRRVRWQAPTPAAGAPRTRTGRVHPQ